MDEPFTDWASGEEVGGFSRASEEEQRRLLQTDLPAPHIRELAARAAAAGAASHSSAEAVAALGSALLRLPGEHGPLVGATARCLCSALYASAHDGGAVALRLADALDALLRRSGGGPESEALLASLATQLDAWPASAAECAPPDGTAAGDSGLEGAALRRQIADECAAMKRVVHEENEALAAAMLARGGRQRERQAGGWQRLLVPALVVASSALVASLVGPRG